VIEAIRLAKDMVRDGVIDRYAVVGTIGAMFYMEPLDTKDFDVMVILSPQDRVGPIVGVRMIEYISARGYPWRGQAVVIGGVPVDFIPASPGLDEEAVEHAVTATYQEEDVLVARPEHLLAIALNVGRRKDFLKASMLLEQAPLDESFLDSIIARYGLERQFKKLEELGT